MRHNEGMVVPPPPVAKTGSARSGRPHRLVRAVFQPIGDQGRAALVERRIADAIMGGVLHAGERLPAETDLAQSFGVAPATAREALLALRERGLITTRRGRHGGSFVADTADPTTFALDALAATSRVALRDAATHYATITAAAVELAARRADPSEIALIRHRLERVDPADPIGWRRASDDAQIELSALSQSARLTREQMRLQAELSPLFALADREPERRTATRERFWALLDAVERGDPTTAVELSRAAVRDAIEWLIDVRETLVAP